MKRGRQGTQEGDSVMYNGMYRCTCKVYNHTRVTVRAMSMHSQGHMADCTLRQSPPPLVPIIVNTVPYCTKPRNIKVPKCALFSRLSTGVG